MVFCWQLMKKVFALLLSEVRKLGATIVFANFFKIIIDTGKTDLPAARAYCDCLLKALQARYVSGGMNSFERPFINFLTVAFPMVGFLVSVEISSSGLSWNLFNSGIPYCFWIRCVILCCSDQTVSECVPISGFLSTGLQSQAQILTRKYFLYCHCPDASRSTPQDTYVVFHWETVVVCLPGKLTIFGSGRLHTAVSVSRLICGRTRIDPLLERKLGLLVVLAHPACSQLANGASSLQSRVCFLYLPDAQACSNSLNDQSPKMVTNFVVAIGIVWTPA